MCVLKSITISCDFGGSKIKIESTSVTNTWFLEQLLPKPQLSLKDPVQVADVARVFAMNGGMSGTGRSLTSSLLLCRQKSHGKLIDVT